MNSIDKLTKMKLDKRFLKVLHGGGPIHIRKTTIIWLLQEECVSSDRLFQVRAKQPYNTCTKLLLPTTNVRSVPQVNDYIKLGEFCLFWDKLVNGVNLPSTKRSWRETDKLSFTSCKHWSAMFLVHMCIYHQWATHIHLHVPIYSKQENWQ